MNRNQKIITCFISLFVLLSFQALYSKELRIAVYDFKSKGVSRYTAEIVSEWIRTAITNSKYTIIERSKISEILKEHELQMTGITDPENAAKIGKMLSANKILSGSITKWGNKYVISGRLIDVEKGISEFGHNEYTWEKSDLDFCTQRFIDNILKKISGNYLPGNKALIKKVKISEKKRKAREKENIIKTIKTLYDAYINKDIDGYLSFIDENAHFWCSAYNIRGKAKIKALRKNFTFVKFDNFDYKLKDINVDIVGKYATVYNRYILKYTIRKNGRRVTESARERFKLIKKGNSWYILENQEY